jgi:uncharacterized membrane protein
MDVDAVGVVQPSVPDRLAGAVQRYVHAYSTAGSAGSLAFFCLSVYPSLLPRPWLFQGLISGISIALGYGAGVLAWWAIRWTFEFAAAPERLRVNVRRVLAIGGPILVVVFVVLGSAWQREVHALVGQPPPDGRYAVRIVALALVSGVGLVGIGRRVRRLFHMVVGGVDRVLPRRVSIGLGFVAVAGVIWWVASGVFFNFFVAQSDRIYASQNASTAPGVTQPTSALRSGSAASLVAWNTLGFQGRNFVAGGPSTAQLAEFTGEPASEPIRVYVGVDSAPDPGSRAELAVAELERTGGFDRSILVVATATGTGWLEPQTVDALEYMYGGDSAIVTQQYSFLPSWIAFLVDKEDAQDAGRALFNEVFAAWSALDEDDRPRLISYGLSLGSFGGQAAFSGVDTLRLAVDGALWVGTPSDAQLWNDITADRDAGTPQYLPVFEEGRTVRFAANPDQIRADQESWAEPRVLYLQHATDPVERPRMGTDRPVFSAS